MLRRVLIAAAIVLAVILLGSLFTPGMRADLTYSVRVTGRLAATGNEMSVGDVYVMSLPSAASGEKPGQIERFHERIDIWDELCDESRVFGLPPPVPPHESGGCYTRPDGRFAFPLRVYWQYTRWLEVPLTSLTPPPRHGIRVLRIEIEGREPVILDAPHGTWTEHPETDEVWATYDLGVIEIPGDE